MESNLHYLSWVAHPADRLDPYVSTEQSFLVPYSTFLSAVNLIVRDGTFVNGEMIPFLAEKDRTYLFNDRSIVRVHMDSRIPPIFRRDAIIIGAPSLERVVSLGKSFGLVVPA